MNNTFETLRKLYAGQSLARVRMNQALASYTLRGRVLDVRGGHSPDYFQYFIKISGTTVEAVDGSMSTIDFEKQALPFADGYADTVILCKYVAYLHLEDSLSASCRSGPDTILILMTISAIRTRRLSECSQRQAFLTLRSRLSEPDLCSRISIR
jgi:hypothetical protein